ncbi:UDP-N-acetyl-D-mannosamine dehydrogenase [Lysobacter olei]
MSVGLKVSVVGLGYIGLPTATMFASRRCEVLGIDVNPHVVETVNQGRIHIVEPELDMLVHAAVSAGSLKAALAPEPADVFLIAVPTPFKDDHIPDLCYVKAAAEAIAPVLRPGNIVILESTSPVGTTEQMVGWLQAARPDLKFPVSSHDTEIDVCVAYCPERVLPGKVVHELVENDRIIGGITPLCSEKAVEIYRIFVEGQLIITNARTAEMCKLTENAYRDVNIAFANELSLICDRMGINVWELIRLANHHPRVNILQPGCGVGGHCIAVDPWFIVDSAPEQAKIIRAAREVNDGKPEWVAAKVKDAVDDLISRGQSRGSLKIAVLGLAFKPDIDDLRESPALQIAERLASEYPAALMIVEPNIDSLPRSLGASVLVGLDEARANADLMVMLVGHKQFADIGCKLPADLQVVDVAGIISR